MDDNARERVDHAPRTGPGKTAGSRQLFLIGERERLRIASELLNNIGQSILLARVKVGMLSGPLMEDEFEALIGEARSFLDQAVKETYTLSRELCPPLLVEAGLETALEWLGRQMAADSGLQVRFTTAGSERPLAVVYGAVVYQAARALLSNVAQHARTGDARLTICWEAGRLRLEVEDHGIGFTAVAAESGEREGSGSGLFEIREAVQSLGGEMVIASTPGAGTLVTIALPTPGGDTEAGQTD